MCKIPTSSFRIKVLCNEGTSQKGKSSKVAYDTGIAMRAYGGNNTGRKKFWSGKHPALGPRNYFPLVLLVETKTDTITSSGVLISKKKRKKEKRRKTRIGVIILCAKTVLFCEAIR